MCFLAINEHCTFPLLVTGSSSTKMLLSLLFTISTQSLIKCNICSNSVPTHETQLLLHRFSMHLSSSVCLLSISSHKCKCVNWGIKAVVNIHRCIIHFFTMIRVIRCSLYYMGWILGVYPHCSLWKGVLYERLGIVLIFYV